MKIERIASKDVTDTLARAMENADRMKSVVVIYETQDGAESPGGVMCNDNATIAQMNYLLDLAKKWIFD